MFSWAFFFFNLGSILGGLKIGFFSASCFGYRVKGVSPLLLPLVSLYTVYSRELKHVLISNMSQFETPPTT